MQKKVLNVNMYQKLCFDVVKRDIDKDSIIYVGRQKCKMLMDNLKESGVV
ncbi:MAG: hypothetical protein UH963_03175 [Agathobacter sp.]|nr:hypothetical protein [Agathobacter sp.]